MIMEFIVLIIVVPQMIQVSRTEHLTDMQTGALAVQFLSLTVQDHDDHTVIP
jgi:hypothetical protein